ncbi:hypothetical protein GUJ93_ZPchr0005g14412 [Zizania palustris]|uniref:Uncharacterized protein n=1 Tax=Zizania palustris TaxID=103762 RepID=A0A8J5SF79_ZIZPA|nr:hypothetical protein GUJ93_ZPchr0005g14412 [Zizania palustris]
MFNLFIYFCFTCSTCIAGISLTLLLWLRCGAPAWPARKKKAENPARRRNGNAAARIMEKIVPGASVIKVRPKRKEFMRRNDVRAPPPSASIPSPDAYPARTMVPALDDGPPGYPADPPTPPLPRSTGGEEDFMPQRRAPPPAAPAPLALRPAGRNGAGAAPAYAAAEPKKATKPNNAPKCEREEPAGAVGAAGGEPKMKTKKLAELNGVVAAAAPPGGAVLKPRFSPTQGDLDGLDLKQTYENNPSNENKKGSENKFNASPGLPAKKPTVRAGDPTKAGVKRGPSDQLEELTTKKKAMLNKTKMATTDKKASGLEQREAAAAMALTASGTLAARQPRASMEKKTNAIIAKKKEPAAAVPAIKRPIKMPSPMALMMTFPPNTTLPSVAALKARFARFGLLDVDGIRVYWKSNTCRVVYKFKSDAEVALNYAKGNAMFGDVKPKYSLVEAPEAAPFRLMETAPFRPGSSGNGAPLPLSRAVPVRTVVGQPKSILKKSTDDGALAALREAPPVKFMRDAGKSKLEYPTAPGGSGGSPDAAPAMKKSAGFAAPPLPRPQVTTQVLTPQPPLQQHQQYPYAPRQTDAPMVFSVPPSLQLPPPPAHPAQQLPRPQVTTQVLTPLPPLQQHQQYPYAPRQTDAPMVFSVPPSLQLPPPPAHPAQQLPHPQVTTQVLTPLPPLQQHQQYPYAPRQTDAPMVFSVPPSLQLPPPPPPPPYQPSHSYGMLTFPGQQPPLPPYPPHTAAGFAGQPQQPHRPNDAQPGLPAAGFAGQPQQPHLPTASQPGLPTASQPDLPTGSQPDLTTTSDDRPAWTKGKKEFQEELMRTMMKIYDFVELLTKLNGGKFPYHLRLGP